jgi:zinc transport system substrate-binding protein
MRQVSLPGGRNAMRAGIAVLLTVISVSCSPGRDAAPADTILVVTSIAPHASLIEALGGDRVTVTALVPPGADPHTFEPLPSDMRTMSGAQVYFTAGLPFEDAWLERISGSCPGLTVISLQSDMPLVPVEGHGASVAGDSQDGALDPHTWMSPELMKQQCLVVERVLASRDPSSRSCYGARRSALEEDIDSLQTRMHAILDPLPQRAFLVLHPSYGYFADEFGLEQIAIEVDGSEPTPSEMAAIAGTARERGLGFVIASPQFSTRTAEALSAELGIPVLVHDPLRGDWMAGLEDLASIIAGEPVDD